MGVGMPAYVPSWAACLVLLFFLPSAQEPLQVGCDAFKSTYVRGLHPSLSLLFKHRQQIAGRVLKPRDLRPAAAEYPSFVRYQAAIIVGLELHAAPDQLIYRLLN